MTSARPRHRLVHRLVAGLVLAVGLAAAGSWSTIAGASPAEPTAAAAGADCSSASLSKQEAIDQLHEVRVSIDKTLRLLDAGDRAAAFDEAKSGYLGCFEGNVSRRQRAH